MQVEVDEDGFVKPEVNDEYSVINIEPGKQKVKGSITTTVVLMLEKV